MSDRARGTVLIGLVFFAVASLAQTFGWQPTALSVGIAAALAYHAGALG